MTQAEQTLQQQNNISNNISETIFTLSLSHNTRTKNGWMGECVRAGGRAVGWLNKRESSKKR